MIITNMPMYRAIVIRNGIGLMLKTKGRVIPNRSWNNTRALRAVSEFTGKTYKRTQLKQAYNDLGQWLEVQKLMGHHLQEQVPL